LAPVLVALEICCCDNIARLLGDTSEVSSIQPYRATSGERRIDIVEFMAIARAIGADPVRLMRALVKRTS
jgi:hypothetical protein